MVASAPKEAGRGGGRAVRAALAILDVDEAPAAAICGSAATSAGVCRGQTRSASFRRWAISAIGRAASGVELRGQVAGVGAPGLAGGEALVGDQILAAGGLQEGFPAAVAAAGVHEPVAIRRS